MHADQSPLVRKLGHGAVLSQSDVKRLDRLTESTRAVAGHSDLIRESDQPENVHLILSGFACRYKMLRNGRRQIVAFFVPGDFCDLHVAILGQMDHSIATISTCNIAEIPRHEVLDLVTQYPRINHALWWATLVDEAVLREWIVRIGQRPAVQKLAHLICEIRLRLNSVGLAAGDEFRFPVTQAELADTLGITTVHVNRMMQQLRMEGLIATQATLVTIPNVERLEDFADFDRSYLHLVSAALARA